MAVAPLNSIHFAPRKNMALLTFHGEAEPPAAISEVAPKDAEENTSDEQPKKHSYWGILAALVVIGAILLLLAKAANKGEEGNAKKVAEDFVENVEDDIEAVKS